MVVVAGGGGGGFGCNVQCGVTAGVRRSRGGSVPWVCRGRAVGVLRDGEMRRQIEGRLSGSAAGCRLSRAGNVGSGVVVGMSCSGGGYLGGYQIADISAARTRMQLGCCARGVGAVVESGARWGRTRLSGVCEWARAGSHVAIRARR